MTSPGDHHKMDNEALVALAETWRRSRPRDAALLQAGLSEDSEAIAKAASFYGAGSFEEVTGSKETLSLRGGRFVWATDDDFEPQVSKFAPPQGLVDTLRRRTPERLCLAAAFPVEKHLEVFAQVGALRCLTHLSVGQMGLGAARPPPALRGLRGAATALRAWLSSPIRLHALWLFGDARYAHMSRVHTTHLTLSRTLLPAHEVLGRLPTALLSNLETLHLRERNVGVSVKGLRKQLRNAPRLRRLHLGDLAPSPSLAAELADCPQVRWTRHGPHEDLARRLRLFGFAS